MDSVIDCTVIATIPKTLLVNKIGAFPNEVMERVDMCLMIALSIGRPVQEDRPDRPEDGFTDKEELDPAAPIPAEETSESAAAAKSTETVVDKFAKFDKVKSDKPNDEKDGDSPPKRIFRRT